MLDIFALIYLVISTLSLLNLFPIDLFEFIDMREGYAISDYGVFLETSTYFNISVIITGLLCGLDAITNPIYKRVNKLLYNYHSLFAFALVGVGLFPITGELGWPVSRVFHWFFALCFLFFYPLTRLLILRYFKKKVFYILFSIFLLLNLLAGYMVFVLGMTKLAYPEYLMAVALLLSIFLSKYVLIRGER